MVVGCEMRVREAKEGREGEQVRRRWDFSESSALDDRKKVLDYLPKTPFWDILVP